MIFSIKWQVCELIRHMDMPFRISWHNQVGLPETINRFPDIPKRLSPETLNEPLSQASSLVNVSQSMYLLNRSSSLLRIQLEQEWAIYTVRQNSVAISAWKVLLENRYTHPLCDVCTAFLLQQQNGKVLSISTWPSEFKAFTENSLTTQKESSQCSKISIVCN